MTLVLVFGAPGPLEDGQVLCAVRNAYPRAIVVGCSTAGEIMGTSVLEDAVVVTAVTFRRAEARAIAATTDGTAGFALGEELGSELARGPLTHVLVFCDGIHVNGSELARGLRASLPNHVATTGGLAGDGERFARTLVVHDGRAWERRVVAVGLWGDGLRVGMGSFGGWDPFGPERRITRSEGNVLSELDGQSALALYEQYLGDQADALPSSGLRFPLSVRTSCGASVVRTLQSVDRARNTMRFAGDVPEGSFARLMKANLDRLIDGAQRAGTAALESLQHDQAQLALLVSCVGRKLVLAQRVEEELEAVGDVLRAIPFAGFYSYGELCPSTRGGRCDLHNQTMTITAFGEVDER